jgi:alpha-tubulin suppressor-like RCC1 family protein
MINPSEHGEHIHPLIPSQLPEFVRVDHPTLVAFLSAYYEWLDTQTDYLYSPMKLGSIIDIDRTMDEFVDNFKAQYLLNFPKSLAINKDTKMPVDDKKLIKNIKAFYTAKGTEKTYEFLFRILYDTNVEFYYPKQDILRLSDGKWIAKKSIKTTAVQGKSLFDAAGKTVVQRNDAGQVLASARVIDVSMYQVGTNSIAELNLSGINGQFVSSYGIEFTDANNSKRKELKVFSVISSVTINNAGVNYRVGDAVVFTPASGDTGLNASGTVQEIDINTGAVKKIRIDNFGVNYNTAPTVSIESFDGSGFSGTVTVGTLAEYAGYYANNDSRLSTNKVLQDNHYFQNFSYVLLTEITIDRYRDVLRKLLHPAGMGFFGRILLKRCNYGDLQKTTSIIKYEVPLIGNYAAYTNTTYDDLSVWFGTTAGDIAGYVPRVHDSTIIGASGNPVTKEVSYVYDPLPKGLTAWGVSGFSIGGGMTEGSTPLFGQVKYAPPTNNKYEKIATGWYHTLAIDGDGGVTSWGYSTTSSWKSAGVGATGVKAIAAGLYLDVAVMGDGSLTYGGSALSQATGHSKYGFWDARNPKTVLANLEHNPNFPVGNDFKQVVVGSSHGYALKNNGTLAYFGITNGTIVYNKNMVAYSEDWANNPSAAVGGFYNSGTIDDTGLGYTSGPGEPAGTTGALLLRFTQGSTSATTSYAFISYSQNHPLAMPIPSEPAVVPGKQYTSSVYVKGASGSSGQPLLLRGIAQSNYSWIKLNEDWQRISKTETAPTTVSNLGLSLGVRGGSAGALGTSPAGYVAASGLTTQVYVWGFQIEEGSTATSFEKTLGFGATSGWYYEQDRGPTGVTFTQIDTFSNTTVGLMSNGGITAWGYLVEGLASVPPGNDYKQVAVGVIHAVALKTDGSLTAWGNASGNKTKVPVGPKFKHISCGYLNSSAIDVDGILYQWGEGTTSGGLPGAPWSYGQSIVPSGAYKFSEVDSGVAHSVGIFDRQELRSSGVGLSAAEPFWIIYQHPNRKITQKVIASIPIQLKSNFLGSPNIIPTQIITTPKANGGWYSSTNIQITGGIGASGIPTAPDLIAGMTGGAVVYGLTNLSTGAAGSATNQKYIAWAGGGNNSHKLKPNTPYTMSIFLRSNDMVRAKWAILCNNSVPGSVAGFTVANLGTGAPYQQAKQSNGPLTLGRQISSGFGNGGWTANAQFANTDWIRISHTAKTDFSGIFTLYMEWGQTDSADRRPSQIGAGRGITAVDIWVCGAQVEEIDQAQPIFLSPFTPSGQVGNYWPEWTQGVTALREEWGDSFTGDSYKYAVLDYNDKTEFRKITARSFFNLPIGSEFNCKYSTTDETPYPKVNVVSLNGKGSPYDLSYLNSNSPVTGGSELTIATSVVNPYNIPYYSAISLWADLYWVSNTAPEISYLVNSKGPLLTTTNRILMSSPFTGIIGGGMFTNYPGNLGSFLLANRSLITANGKFRLVFYYKDNAGKKIPQTETSTEFIYQYIY